MSAVLTQAESATFNDRKTPLLANILQQRYGEVHKLLVVGCGSGIEAALLARTLNCDVVGIDLNPNFDKRAAQLVDLRVGDATAMTFADGEFDFVYSYHALEHIPDTEKALSEMRRVLRLGGPFMIGTPNRSRFLGYVGTSTPFSEKVRWNMADWKMRVQGKFRNECGAHAGFTRGELTDMARRTFGTAHDVSLEYYRAVYSNKARAVNILAATGLSKFAFPSVYIAGVNLKAIQPHVK